MPALRQHTPDFPEVDRARLRDVLEHPVGQNEDELTVDERQRRSLRGVDEGDLGVRRGQRGLALARYARHSALHRQPHQPRNASAQSTRYPTMPRNPAPAGPRRALVARPGLRGESGTAVALCQTVEAEATDRVSAVAPQAYVRHSLR